MKKSIVLVFAGIVIGIIVTVLLSFVASSVFASESNDNEVISIGNDSVEVVFKDDYSVDTSVNTDNFGISIDDVDDDGVESGEVTHDELGKDTSDTLQAGLCSVGLDDNGSFIFDVSESGDVEIEDNNVDDEINNTTPDKVLENCT